MFKFLKKLLRDRRGNALIIAGAALPLIIGAAGLAADTVQWALWKRQLQRAADSAALAGVYAEAQGNAINYTSATYAQPVGWDVKQNNKAWPTTTCTVQNPPDERRLYRRQQSSEGHAVGSADSAVLGLLRVDRTDNYRGRDGDSAADR